MHVAFLIDNLGSGGAQRQAVEIAVHLRREAGLRVGFGVYRRNDFFRPRLEAAGIPVHDLPKRGGPDPLFPRRLRAWIEREAPDVVHAFGPMPTLWAALASRGLRGPRPVWIAAERSSPHENVGPWVAWALRRLYGAYDAVTANSRPAARALAERFGVDPGRVHYLPNGIDLAEWDRRAAGPVPIDLEPGRFHLALVGRISEEKNHRLFLAALARVAPEARRDLRVWLVGAEDGPPRFLDGIRAEIASLGLADCLRMLPPTPELPALMARLDALVLPSRYEGFPNVVLEAMASRLPVLASAVGDVPSLVEDGRTGFVVPAGDVAGLAAGLERLLSASAETRAAMGAAGRAAVESRYRIEHVAELHRDLYRRLAGPLRTEDAASAGDAAAGGLG
jgi:glycosyltransferase involved in cell wall biosynthesis